MDIGQFGGNHTSPGMPVKGEPLFQCALQVDGRVIGNVKQPRAWCGDEHGVIEGIIRGRAY